MNYSFEILETESWRERNVFWGENNTYKYKYPMHNSVIRDCYAEVRGVDLNRFSKTGTVAGGGNWDENLVFPP